jgi:hypothetical protein
MTPFAALAAAVVVVAASCARRAQPIAAVDDGAGDASAGASGGPSAPPSAGSSPAPGPAPGKVRCGALDCDVADEICCVEAGDADAGRCIGKATATASHPCGGGSAERRCDDSSDCGAGEACCRSIDCSGGRKPCLEPRCTERWSCAAIDQCSVSNRRCSKGSTCPTGECRDGFCPEPPLSPSCGEVTCRPGETCCWDERARKGTCEARLGDACYDRASEASTTTHRTFSEFSCQRPRDCGDGYACFTDSGNLFYEAFACHHVAGGCNRGFDTRFLCDDTNDCPEALFLNLGPGKDGRIMIGAHRRTSCRHFDSDPPRVKSCGYEPRPYGTWPAN